MIEVLIPAFNAEKTIESAVESILRQSERSIRILVIDDGSTDRTGEILASMAKRDTRLEVITTENRGIVDALNTGLSRCRADIVARHDADDIAYPDRLARQLSYLNANPECVAAAGNVWLIDDAGRRIGRNNVSGDAKGDARAVPSREPYLLHPFLMARRAAIETVGGYRHAFHAEDTDLYWRLLPLGRLHNMGEILGEYRIHAASITSRSILNARIGAINAQLAALSATRRSAGTKDLVFDRAMLQSYEDAISLHNMILIASRQLDQEEETYLEVSTAAKMVELRNVRRFRFTKQDIRYIVYSLYKHRRTLKSVEKRRIVRQALHNIRPKFGLRGLALRFSSARTTESA